MSSITIITSIFVLLSVLVCYAFIVQSITQKRQQKARFTIALKTRARNFKFMLSGFPAGFLPKELTLLVQRSLMHIHEQLAKLEPNNSSHRSEAKEMAQKMGETQQLAPSAGNVRLDNPQQMRDIKLCLEELYKFIFQLEAQHGMIRSQADGYRAMIKRLVLQVTVDSYMLQARLAREKGKTKLAAHHFDLALQLMVREQTGGHFDERIAQVRQAVAELATATTSGGDAPDVLEEHVDDHKAINHEWDKFEQQGTDWKKKQIYD